MQVARRRQAEPALQQDLPRRAVGEVFAANDVGDALLGIVDDDRELVREDAVGALAGRSRRPRAPRPGAASPRRRSCQAITAAVVRHRRRGTHAQADRACRLAAEAGAAGARDRRARRHRRAVADRRARRCRRREREVASAAGAGKGAVGREQALQRGLVACRPRRLMDDRRVRRRGRGARAARRSPRPRRRRCAACRGLRCGPASARRARAHRATRRGRRPASRHGAGRWATARSGRRRAQTLPPSALMRRRPARRRRSARAARAVSSAPSSRSSHQRSASPSGGLRVLAPAAARRLARHSRVAPRARRRCTVLTSSRPAATCSRTIGSGTKPQPMLRSRASILACMSLTVSTSWPGSRLTVIGVMRWAESATATARWRISSRVARSARPSSPAHAAARPRRRSPSGRSP